MFSWLPKGLKGFVAPFLCQARSGHVVSDFTVKGLSTVIVLKWQVLHSVSVLPVQFASEQLEFLIRKLCVALCICMLQLPQSAHSCHAAVETRMCNVRLKDHRRLKQDSSRLYVHHYKATSCKPLPVTHLQPASICMCPSHGFAMWQCLPKPVSGSAITRC